MSRLSDELDSRGFEKPVEIIGDIITHTGNQKQYIIMGIVWMGHTDEWGYLHRAICEDDALITRPLSNLCGKRSNGEFRYYEFGDYDQFALE